MGIALLTSMTIRLFHFHTGDAVQTLGRIRLFPQAEVLHYHSQDLILENRLPRTPTTSVWWWFHMIPTKVRTVPITFTVQRSSRTERPPFSHVPTWKAIEFLPQLVYGSVDE